MRFLEAKRLKTEGENKMLTGTRAVPENKHEPSSSVQASAAAKDLAERLGVNLDAITGTGRDGLITATDVRRAHDDAEAQKSADTGTGSETEET